MIYISETDTKLTLPKHLLHNDISSISIINNLTGEEYAFELESDLSENSFYYEFDLALGTLPTGEYTYKLGEEIGLITIGDYTPSNTHYQIDVNKIQYDRN